MVPHPRTLRKARERVKCMVIDEVSLRQIRNYLHRWILWWQNTSDTWQYQELLQRFIDTCWRIDIQGYAAGLYQLHLNESQNQTLGCLSLI